MNGIVINIDPVAFHLGAFYIHWYSLAIILAIIAAVLISAQQGNVGMSEKEKEDLVAKIIEKVKA